MGNVVTKHSISSELAQKMIDQAVAKARQMGVAENVAIARTSAQNPKYRPPRPSGRSGKISRCIPDCATARGRVTAAITAA